MLASTGIEAGWLNRVMQRSHAQQVVLLLDCCYGGAFARGVVARSGGGVDVGDQFVPPAGLAEGRGRVVITASTAMEYAFEGAQLASGAGRAGPSVFTGALVEGIRTGDADRDGDGAVSLSELYDYVYDRVREVSPRQTPGKWEFGVHGSLLVARNPHRRIMPDPLPPEVLDLVEHSTSAGRLAAVGELARLAAGANLNRGAAARNALTRLADDDSRGVSAAAAQALDGVTVRLSRSVIDLGQVPPGSPPLVADVAVEGGPLALASTVLASASGASAGALRARLDADILRITWTPSQSGPLDAVVTLTGPAGQTQLHITGNALADPAPPPKLTAPSEPAPPTIPSDSITLPDSIPSTGNAGHREPPTAPTSVPSDAPPPQAPANSTLPAASSHDHRVSRAPTVPASNAPTAAGHHRGPTGRRLIAAAAVLLILGAAFLIASTRSPQTPSHSPQTPSQPPQTPSQSPRTPRQIGAPLTGHTDGVGSVAFSPDGKTLATGSADNTVRLWDVARRRALGTPLTGHTGWVFSVAFSPDGKTLATGSDDHTVRLWDVARRRALGTPLTGHTGWVFSVAFSPDGKTLATGSDDSTVRLWDVARRRALGTPLTGHTDSVYSVAFSPDGKTLATGSADNTVRLWDVATRRALGTPLTGHTGIVESVAFSPDGKTLATGSDDSTVRLWDVARRRALGTPLTGHTGWVFSVAFSPDGKTLAIGGDDHTVRLWDVTR